MGLDLALQAIPEDCELLRRARQDREIAERIQSLHHFTEDCGQPENPIEALYCDLASELFQTYPDLVQRFVYTGGRRWDQIIYLLSPARRAGDWWYNDKSLIYRAIWGSEPLHPEAIATQGIPIGFVPAQDVRTIADFLDTVTYEQLYEHYNPALMKEKAVYKIHSSDKIDPYIWEEFTEIRDLYRAAAEHNEAVITVID